MDGFDDDPTNFASTSLACGAVAIDPADADRVYVGTGEGDTDACSPSDRDALPAYRGIGPDPQRRRWRHLAQRDEQPLVGRLPFFQIAVDPAEPRTLRGGHDQRALRTGSSRVAAFTWQRRRTGIHTSVVVTRTAGTTTWFAAAQADRVLQLDQRQRRGPPLGTGFPTGIGRIALGVQPDNPNVLYAFIATSAGALHSVQRLDGAAGAWRTIAGVPAVLPGGQGIVRPVHRGRSEQRQPDLPRRRLLQCQPVPGSIWRCDVSTTGDASR